MVVRRLLLQRDRTYVKRDCFVRSSHICERCSQLCCGVRQFLVNHEGGAILLFTVLKLTLVPLSTDQITGRGRKGGLIVDGFSVAGHGRNEYIATLFCVEEVVPCLDGLL